MLQFNNNLRLCRTTRSLALGIACMVAMMAVSSESQCQSANLRGLCSVDCGASQLCMQIQVQSAGPTTFRLGTSSILITYHESAISFLSYTPDQFDQMDLCNGGAAAWQPQTTDAADGRFSLTAILIPASASQSCPLVDDQQWFDLGEVCFSVTSSNVFPNLMFDTLHSHLNINLPDDGVSQVSITAAEVFHATCLTDSDSDGIADIHDNCQNDVNPLQEDSDHDGIGDVCDPQCNFIVDASPDIEVCEGSMITLTALTEEGVAPFSYLWSTGDTTAAIDAVVSSAQSFFVTMTDANACVGFAGTDVSVTDGSITGVSIFDLDLEQVFAPVNDGDTFYWSTLPPLFNFEVLATSNVDCIGFVVEGAQYDEDRENSLPYRYPGDFDDFEPWTGDYTMTITTFSENNQRGVSCDEWVLHFTIVDDCAKLHLPEVVPLCLGETVTIQSGVEGTHGAYVVQWSNGMVGDSITVTPTETFYLTATVIDQSNCSVSGLTEVHVTSADIATVMIWDVDANAPFDTIEGGEIYHIDSFPDNYNIRAITIQGNTQSVGFDLAADFGVWGHTDNQPPYQFPGNTINFWQDNFTITVAAWDEDWRNGYSCGSYTYAFQVVDYNPDCNLVTNTNDSGPGSLPNALNCAQWWQTVYFDPAVHHDTIVLENAYALFSTGCKLSALTEHGVYIKAMSTPYALYIEPGVSTRIDGVHIIAGTAAQGAAIYNAGEVTVENVFVQPHPGMATEQPVLNLGTMHVRGVLDVKSQ